MKISNKSKIVLIITHVIPYPPSAGNEIRILNLLKWFKSEGYRIILLLKVETLGAHILTPLKEFVHAVYLIPKDNLTLKTRLNQKFLQLLGENLQKKKSVLAYTSLFSRQNNQQITDVNYSVKDALCPLELVKTTRKLYLKYNPSIVIAEYIFTSPCLDVIPSSILKIIDTHDMFSRRKEYFVKYGIEDPLACTAQEERNYLLKCNLILAIHLDEERLFRQLVHEKEVLTVGIDYDVINEIDNSDVIQNTILFVASDNQLNIHGLTGFYKNAWPLIFEKNPKAILRVIGKIGSCLQVDDKRVEIIGWIENLDQEYRKAAVVINPTIAGTGLKIKSIEALCRGKPLVTWPNGIEGIDYTGEAPFCVCNSWSDFAGSVMMLLEFKEKRVKLQYQALQFAKQNFSSSNVYSALAQRLQQH